MHIIFHTYTTIDFVHYFSLTFILCAIVVLHLLSVLL